MHIRFFHSHFILGNEQNEEQSESERVEEQKRRRRRNSKIIWKIVKTNHWKNHSPLVHLKVSDFYHFIGSYNVKEEKEENRKQFETFHFQHSTAFYDPKIKPNQS